MDTTATAALAKVEGSKRVRTRVAEIVAERTAAGWEHIKSVTYETGSCYIDFVRPEETYEHRVRYAVLRGQEVEIPADDTDVKRVYQGRRLVEVMYTLRFTGRREWKVRVGDHEPSRHCDANEYVYV
jgi:hypothetical protein